MSSSTEEEDSDAVSLEETENNPIVIDIKETYIEQLGHLEQVLESKFRGLGNRGAFSSGFAIENEWLKYTLIGPSTKASIVNELITFLFQLEDPTLPIVKMHRFGIIDPKTGQIIADEITDKIRNGYVVIQILDNLSACEIYPRKGRGNPICDEIIMNTTKKRYLKDQLNHLHQVIVHNDLCNKHGDGCNLKYCNFRNLALSPAGDIVFFDFGESLINPKQISKLPDFIQKEIKIQQTQDAYNSSAEEEFKNFKSLLKHKSSSKSGKLEQTTPKLVVDSPKLASLSTILPPTPSAKTKPPLPPPKKTSVSTYTSPRRLSARSKSPQPLTKSPKRSKKQGGKRFYSQKNRQLYKNDSKSSKGKSSNYLSRLWTNLCRK